MDDIDLDLGAMLDGSGNRLKTKIPGVEVTTQLGETDAETLEAIHRRQLEWALEHAEEAKESTRL